MSSYTYSSFKSALITIVEDSGSEFSDAIDSYIIKVGEDRVLSDLDLRIFDQEVNGFFTAGTPYVNKPQASDLIIHVGYLDNNGRLRLLEHRDYSYLIDYWPNSSSTTSAPKYYTNISTTQFYVAGTPAQSFSYKMSVYRRPQSLSASNPETWLSTNVGELLLYACLISCEEYLKADERVQLWAAEYQKQLARKATELANLRRLNAPVVNSGGV